MLLIKSVFFFYSVINKIQSRLSSPTRSCSEIQHQQVMTTKMSNSENHEINNAWLESMRASSPTRLKSTPSTLEERSSWILHHPSALDMFGQIMEATEGKQIVMFLDYDGTLSPIVDDPDRALMSNSMRKTVRKLAKCFPTAIVTGRCNDKVYNFVQLPELYYAGSHGFDIKSPTTTSKYKYGVNIKAKPVLFQPASDFLPMIDEVYKQLVDKTKSIPGAKVENNKFCCVDEENWSELAQQVNLVLKDFPTLHLTSGRKVLEIRPTIKWDKGKALEFLLQSLGLANRRDVFPIYIGDDRSDEDAFKKLRDRGQGLGILVSKFPKDTSASFSLREPKEVMNFLQLLVEWKCACIPVTYTEAAESSKAPETQAQLDRGVQVAEPSLKARPKRNAGPPKKWADYEPL